MAPLNSKFLLEQCYPFLPLCQNAINLPDSIYYYLFREMMVTAAYDNVDCKVDVTFRGQWSLRRLAGGQNVGPRDDWTVSLKSDATTRAV